MAAGPLLFTLAALTVTALPYLLRGPWWFSLSLLALLGWRAVIARRGLRQPPLAVLFGLAVLLGWGLNAANGGLLGRDGGTPLLLLLTVLKAHETRRIRDGKLLVLLGLFCLSANFFFTQDTLTFLHAALSTTLLMAALVIWAQPSAAPIGNLLALRLPALGRALTLILQALPLTILLFVLFPRPDGPLWQMPLRGGSGASTGLSDSVTPGSVSSLAQSDAVALRVVFQGRVPPESRLYWRGPVLEAFDGRSWTRGPRLAQPPTDLQASGPALSYSLTLEPGSGRWLTPLDLPVAAPAGAQLDSNLVLTGPDSATRARYPLQSSPDAHYGLNPLPGQLGYDLELPPGINPRARALAAGWAGLSPWGRVLAALKLLGSGQYVYTLDPPLLNGPDPVDQLLFATRQGFCEHYAGAFAFLMRAAGVPARLVTGYQGGEPNGGYLIVRDADAHAWTEVWLAGQGWVRIDPTAVVAPLRIEKGLAAALPQNQLPGLLQGGWLSRLSLRLDRLQNLWNQWVIGYDGAQQQALLSRLGLGAVGGLKYLLAVVAAMLVAGVPLALALRRGRERPDPLRAAYDRLGRRLHLPRLPSETASVWAMRASAAFPALAGELQDLTAAFQRLRYGPDAPPGERRAFVRQAGRLRRSGKPQP